MVFKEVSSLFLIRKILVIDIYFPVLFIQLCNVYQLVVALLHQLKMCVMCVKRDGRGISHSSISLRRRPREKTE